MVKLFLWSSNDKSVQITFSNKNSNSSGSVKYFYTHVKYKYQYYIITSNSFKKLSYGYSEAITFKRIEYIFNNYGPLYWASV
jgi:hypothetical protein